MINFFNEDIKFYIWKTVYKYKSIFQGNKFIVSFSLKHSHYQYSNNTKYTMKNARNDPKSHHWDIFSIKI